MNIFDQFDPPPVAAPPQPAPRGGNVFDQFDGEAEKGSFAGNLARTAVGQGLMLSTGDEALAYARSKWFGTPYEEELGKERKKLEQFREESPVTAMAAEIGGGMLLPVGGMVGAGAKAASALARGGAVGRAAAKPVDWASRAMTLKRGDSLGKTAGKGFATSAAFGGPALFGAGEGDAASRTANMAENLPLVAAVGTLGAPTARAIGSGVSSVARHIRSTPEQIAARRGAEAFDAARLDPDELAAEIAPLNTRAKIKTTPDQDAAVISARLAGQPFKQIAKDNKLSPFVVQRVWRDFEKSRARAPLNIMERASLRGDESAGASRPISELGRAAANIPGKGQSIAFERSLEKQLGQRGRVGQLVDETFGAEDFTPRIEQIEDALTRKAGTAYDQLYRNSPVMIDDDLARVIVTPVARPFWEKARALAAAEGGFIPTFEEIAYGFSKSPTKSLGFLGKGRAQPEAPPANAPIGMSLPVSAIDYFQRALRLEAKGAFRSGRGAEGATAAAIRKRLLDVVDPRIPGYKSTREAYAEGKMAEEALKGGRSFVLRAGQRADDTLKQFDKMLPEQQELFRIGMGQAMKDMLANKQATHDLTASLRTKAAQDAYRRVLGEETANRFIGDVLQEAEITRSTRFLTEGSRTAPMLEAQKKLLEEEQFVSDVISLKPMGLISGTAKRLARVLSERNNAALADMLTTTDEGQMLRALREISGAMKKEGRRVSGRVSVPATVAGGIQIGKEQGR